MHYLEITWNRNEDKDMKDRKRNELFSDILKCRCGILSLHKLVLNLALTGWKDISTRIAMMH